MRLGRDASVVFFHFRVLDVDYKTRAFNGSPFHRMLHLRISEQRVFLTLMNDRTVLLQCRVQDNGFILIDVALELDLILVAYRVATNIRGMGRFEHPP